MKAMRHVVLAAVLSALSLGVAPQEPSPIEIAFVGQFLVSPMRDQQGSWHALIPTTNGVALVETQVEVSKSPDECGGTTFTKIAAPNSKEAFLLIRGAGLLHPGPVTSYFKGQQFIHPAEEVLFRLKSGIGAGFKAYGTATPGEAETFVTNYELRMHRGGMSQTLATFRQLDWDGLPRLLWAGDLDGDDNLDALFNLQTHYAGNNFVLFLSSVAESGQLVKRVAEFETSGC